MNQYQTPLKMALKQDMILIIGYDCYESWCWNDDLPFGNRVKILFGTFWTGVWNYGIKSAC